LRGERPTEQQNLQIRRALWAACRALDAEGRSVHAISRALNIDWHAARRLLDMPAPPDRPVGGGGSGCGRRGGEPCPA